MSTMKTFVVTGPNTSEIADEQAPIADAGFAVIEVQRVGVCGTDVEFFKGDMAYLHDGNAHFPMRLGHEWMGTVVSVGRREDEKWLGLRVTGDTMLGCGVCRRCMLGHQHVCEFRVEIGVRGGFPGALAEQLRVPVTALQTLPDNVYESLGALVEPGANALRCVWGSKLGPGERLLVIGPGTIGLLVALLAKSQGIEVHVAGTRPDALAFARTLGIDGAWLISELPALQWDAVVDATNDSDVPAQALDLVEPGGRIVLIGLGTHTGHLDSRLLTIKDVTAVGILSGSPALSSLVDIYASGQVDPRPLVAATVGLGNVGHVLAGERPSGAGPGPKIHVDPRR